MYLTRLMYLSSSNQIDNDKKKNDLSKSTEAKNIISDFNNDAVSQIKNVTQEKKIKPEIQNDIKNNKNLSINSFDKLLEICHQKKEIKLKYELEKNVNLVNFEKNRQSNFNFILAIYN